VVLAGYHLLTHYQDLRSIRLAAKDWWRPALFYTVVTVPWFIFAWAYFGTPLPATLAAKQAQGMLPVSQGYLAGLGPILTDYLPVTNWLVIGLALVGLIYGVRRHNLLILPVVWAVLFFAAYSTLGVTSYFWYYTPIIPALIVTAGLGTEALGKWVHFTVTSGAHRLYRPSPKDQAKGRIGRATAQIIQVAVTMCCITITLAGQVSKDLALAQAGDSRMPIYRAVGEWLQAHTEPASSVGALEIGAIGFYSQRRMVDFAGLIQPPVARQLPLAGTYEDSAIWAWTHYQPDYLVLQAHVFPRLEQALMARPCRSVQTFPGATYGYHVDLQIFHCPAG
jgi:hypothetical protein